MYTKYCAHELITYTLFSGKNIILEYYTSCMNNDRLSTSKGAVISGPYVIAPFGIGASVGHSDTTLKGCKVG